MEISSQSNNYQMMNTHQQPNPITTPVEPNEPKYTNGEIYEASQGNLIRDDGDISLTPQGENNINNAKQDNADEASAEAQAKTDAQRGVAVDYIGAQSKQSQVEIYLAVATDGKVEVGGNDTADVIESLRDVQKQNNAVAAYATYEENQNPVAKQFG
jgi:hypothetical protein